MSVRKHRHTVRLGDGEERVAQEVMQQLDCKSVPEMFRLLLDYTQIPDIEQFVVDRKIDSRPPIQLYANRIKEVRNLRRVLEKIKDALCQSSS